MADPHEIDDGEVETPNVVGDMLRAALSDDLVEITSTGVASLIEDGAELDKAIKAVKRVVRRPVIIFTRRT